MCPCGTGPSHQPHCGLMKKHLQGIKKKTHVRATMIVIIKYFQVFVLVMLKQKNIVATHHFTPHTVILLGMYIQEILCLQWSLSCRVPHSTMSEYFSVSGLKTEPHKMSSCGSCSLAQVKTLQMITNHSESRPPGSSNDYSSKSYKYD